jgi:hypothetical protein
VITDHQKGKRSKQMRTFTVEDLQTMHIKDIIAIIRGNFISSANYAAKPYIDALLQMDENGNYGWDSWKSMTNYLLANLSQWKVKKDSTGINLPKLVKEELKRRVKLNEMNPKGF